MRKPRPQFSDTLFPYHQHCLVESEPGLCLWVPCSFLHVSPYFVCSSCQFQPVPRLHPASLSFKWEEYAEKSPPVLGYRRCRQFFVASSSSRMPLSLRAPCLDIIHSQGAFFPDLIMTLLAIHEDKKNSEPGQFLKTSLLFCSFFLSTFLPFSFVTYPILDSLFSSRFREVVKGLGIWVRTEWTSNAPL